MMIVVDVFFEPIFGFKLLVTNLEVLNKRDLLNRLYVQPLNLTGQVTLGNDFHISSTLFAIPYGDV